MKVVDTTVAIGHLRGHEPATSLLERLVAANEELVASELVRFELLAGVRDEELEATEQLFSALAWMPVDEAVSRAAGSLAGFSRTFFFCM